MGGFAGPRIGAAACRRVGRAASGMALSAAVVGAVLTAPPMVAAADPAPAGNEGIGKHDEELLAEAKRSGQRSVSVLVATEPGTAARGAEALAQAGATVQHRADELGYVRAEVPVDDVERVAALPGVDALDLDDEIVLPGLPWHPGKADPGSQPQPDADTPRVNPYLPTGDTGAAQFVEGHPSWDGRGVTVGVVGTGIDLGHPALQATSTGERKIVDWVTRTDGRFTGGVNNDDDPTWIDMSTEVSGPTFTAGGAEYRAAEGSYRFGVFDERDPRLGGELGNDVDRDGNPSDSTGTFGVLWDRASNTVWVDADQNRNFTDDPPMTDYKVSYDVGTFGTDDPDTPVREAMPFVVQTDPDNNSVNIGIVSGAGGTHVAGVVAGNSLFGGAMSGAAPGAKLVSVRVCLFVAGCTAHALLEGMIYAARDANVDVITMSFNGLPALNDGDNARAELYNRLIDTYDVQMFIAAGDSGPGSNTVADPSVADDVMSVGSYISKDTWQHNYGSDSARQDTLHGFSARGPREDGGFKPDIVAPGSAVTTAPTWQQGRPVPGSFALPPGYAVSDGTAIAAAQSAGAATLLVSAARDGSVEHGPAQLRRALADTARFIPGYQAYEQGNGLIDVGKAWGLLRDGVETVDISSSVPVNTALSDFLATPDVGVGIHDREGVTLGDSYVREYTFVRHSGPDRPVTYQARWVGNDGTFSSRPTVQLRKGEATAYRVTVEPRSAGAHSAILELNTPTTTGTDHRTLNTVMAAEEFGAHNGFAVRHVGKIGRNETRSFFVRVEPNTPALTVDLQRSAGQLRSLRFHPYGVGVDSNSPLSCYDPVVTPDGSCAGSPTSRTVADPAPGVWEIVLEARHTSDAAFAPYLVTASVLGASVSPNPDTIESVRRGEPVERQYTVQNRFGPFTGRAVGTSLGSARVATPTISDGEQRQFPVTVPDGATQLTARIGNPADTAADLDLHLFDCTSGSCVQAAVGADDDSEEQVTVTDPAAGQWMVLVSGYSVPAGSTTYSYLDVFSGPSFGSLEVDDADTLRPAGAEWTVDATLTPSAAPAEGRVLLGHVEVRTDEDVLVGTGEVIIDDVTG